MYMGGYGHKNVGAHRGSQEGIRSPWSYRPVVVTWLVWVLRTTVLCKNSVFT